MRIWRLRKHKWFSQGQTTNQESTIRSLSQAERLQNSDCTRSLLKDGRKRKQIHMMIKELERREGSDGRDVENLMKEKCHVPREREDRGRERTKMSQMGKQR